MAGKNKLLTVLSEAEQYALYGLPDFDDAQRLEYLALTETELALGLWEIRVNLSGGRKTRVFSCAYEENIVLLHDFIKKSQKTPINEMAVAVKRMKGLRL